MGRGKRGRTQRRDFKDGRENVWKKPREDGYAPFILESPAFEMYYKEQGIMPEEEWETFLATLRKQLPTTFRINGRGQYAVSIRDQMRRDFFDYLKDETEIDGEKVEPVRHLPWYPDKLAWHLSFSRSQLRKVPILERIHEFLKAENEVGNITRQEAVSMVPPLFLDVQPEHRVLDMCAAPGSKTFQLLEILHSKDESGYLPKGAVIANDSDVQRCNLLIHQTKRMCSPNLLVTNHEAQHFPGLKQKKAGEEGEERRLTFDRILCDVPCSGDGTIRKAPDLWKKWNSGTGNGLHRLQIHIAMRGVALLNVGGRMVYSTCSLNPIEDEAVVGEILRLSEGSMELLDVSSELSDLKRRPGLKSWKVRGRKNWYSHYASYQKEDKHRAGLILPSMFPSGKRLEKDDKLLESSEDKLDTTAKLEETHLSNVVEKAEVTDLPLERCMRILPHDQDTGGFFIAVFKKVQPYIPVPKNSPKESLAEAFEETAPDPVTTEEAEGQPAQVEVEEAEGKPTTAEMAEAEEQVNEATEQFNEAEAAEQVNETAEQFIEAEAAATGTKGKPQKQGPWHGVDPVLFLEDETIISSLISYYGIRETFPLRGHLVIRSEDTSRVKRIYYISKSVADVFQLNLQANQMLKVTSAGLKIFERHSNKEVAFPCHFRIASEGLPYLLPHITKQKLYASQDDFKLLLSPNPVNFAAFQDPEFSRAVQDLLVGCCVVVLKDSNEETAIGCWRGRTNMSLLVPRAEADQLLKKLYPSDAAPKVDSDVSKPET